MDESSMLEDATYDESTNLLNDHVDVSALEVTETTQPPNSKTILKSCDLSVTLRTEEQAQLRKTRNKNSSASDMMECTVDTITATSYAEPIADESADLGYSVAPERSEFLCNPMIEIGRRLWESTELKQQYTKGCAWSPDGTCILVCVQFDGMHVIELPRDMYGCQDVSVERPMAPLPTAVYVSEGGTVYDFCWYPQMTSENPASCCWLASRQHEPIHMWDAFNGELRCSYRGYDEVDEVEAAISVAFSYDGDKVFGGYKKSIKVFDTVIPGRKCSSIPVKKAISCFGVTSENDQTITAGTWNGYIHHYDLRSPKLGALFTLGGHKGGITWLRYLENSDDMLLFSGARKEGKILLWDMRNYTKPLREYERTVETNQRVYFDVDPLQQWLVSGSTDGTLRAWDLTSESTRAHQIPLHTDCCNGVSFHPSRPIMASTAGQYHFTDDTVEDESNTTAAEETVVEYENSLVMLWYGKNQSAAAEY